MLTTMDLDTHTITLTATHWSLDIYKSQTYPNAAMVMRADCSWADDQLMLGTGGKLEPGGSVIALAFYSGTPEPGKPERGIGLFICDAPSLFSGWLYLPPDRYNEVWTQAGRGAFTDCKISLELAPFIWSHRPVWDVEATPHLFILGAIVCFGYGRR